MIYASIDIETSGIDPNTHKILELCAIIDDLEHPKPLGELPTFHCYVQHTGTIPFQIPAAVINYKLLKLIMRIEKSKSTMKESMLRPENQVYDDLRYFFLEEGFGDREHGVDPSITVAGKNIAGFDIPFISALPKGVGRIKFRHRVLDVGPLYMTPVDFVVPDLTECARRAGIQWQSKHSAKDDAQLVIQLVRHHYHKQI